MLRADVQHCMVMEAGRLPSPYIRTSLKSFFPGGVAFIPGKTVKCPLEGANKFIFSSRAPVLVSA